MQHTRLIVSLTSLTIALSLSACITGPDGVEGDTDVVPQGTGTFGSRSIAIGGSALHGAAMKVVAKGKLIAAHMLEAAMGDIAFVDGWFTVAGTDRKDLWAGLNVDYIHSLTPSVDLVMSAGVGYNNSTVDGRSWKSFGASPSLSLSTKF